MRATTLALVLVLGACEPERLTIGPDAPIGRDETTGPPNVLLILTDDQDAKALWVSPTVRTQIADHGLTMARAFVTTSICGPSRVSILRGQYAHNTTVYSNSQAWPRSISQGLDQSTVATWLHGAGYATGWVGKYLNGYGLTESDAAYIPPGWDEWTVVVPSQGTGYYPTRIIEDGAWVTHDGTYSTDFLTARAVRFINDHAAEPWLLVVSYYGPHDPETPAPRHAGAFASLAGLRPPSFNVPKVGIPTMRQNPLPQGDINGIDTHYRRRLETLLAVDEGVGDLMAALDSTGVLDNTLVIYTSDNGYLLGEHAEQQKNLPYEEANRVPMIIRGPGVKHGTTKKIVANIDLAPTIADYAGVTPPSFVDGRSLRPLLETQLDGSEWRKRILVEHRRETTIYQAGIRTNSQFYSEWSPGGERELYDMTEDTFQVTNTALPGPSQHATLRAWLGALKTCAGATCRTAATEGP